MKIFKKVLTIRYLKSIIIKRSKEGTKGQVAEWLKAADCGLWYQIPKIAAHTSDCMMNTGLIRGILNSKADGNPELEKKFLSVETLYLAS